jgi:membrane associated rhomboid family serine protease
MDENNIEQTPILPVVRQPRGLKYYLGTWSGRILLLNTIIFAYMVLRNPSSLFMPSLDYVRTFGSKSVADIAAGEYWRFITPMFVHIGILHFFFNAMGLYYIGYQIEHILGARWFVGLYLAAGVLGNLASCVFSISLSAGASGALFGLLGAGYRLEGLVSDSFDQAGVKVRPRRGIYSGMVITNILLGLVIPVIDNAAHIGGLIAGWLIVEAMLRTRPNRLRRRRPAIAALIYVALTGFAIFAVARTVDPVVVVARYFEAAAKASDAREAYYNYSEILRVKPLNPKARLLRGKLLLQNREIEDGLSDIEKAISAGVSQADVESVIDELKMTGHLPEAELLKRKYDEMSGREL